MKRLNFSEEKNFEEVVDQSYEILKQVSNGETRAIVDANFRTQKHRITEALKIALPLINTNLPILEIGSFPYLATLSLVQVGVEVFGIDLHPDQILHKLNEKFYFSVKKGNIETDIFPFEDNQFETIILWEVFEHLRIDLIFTCQQISRVLKPGGVLLLSTPNFLRYNKLMHLIKKRESGEIFKAYNCLKDTKYGAGHIREYTPKDVINFMNKIGLKHKETVYFGSANIGTKPGELLQFFAHKSIPASRNFFMLVLTK